MRPPAPRPTARRRSRRNRPPTARPRRPRPGATTATARRSDRFAGYRDTDQRMTKPGAIRTSVAVLTADPAFEQSLRATFGASGQIDLRVVSGSISTVARIRHRRRDRRHHRSRCRPRRRDAGAGADDAADRRRAAGRRGHAELRRRRGAQPVADAGCGFPGEAGAAARAGADLRAGRAARTRPRPPKLRSTASSRRSAAPASRPWRSRPRCCCSTAASASGRPLAWSISTSSTAPAPIISISNRGSTSRRSSRGRSGSTASFWRSCCRTMPRVSR